MSELPETFVEGFHDENEVKKMKYLKFGNTNMNVSQLSIGTGGFCEQYGDYTIDECKATLLEALKRGINYIDTAPWYGCGVSEEVLGKCLEGIPRQAYYIATKIGRYEKGPQMFDFSAKRTQQSIDISLKKLGLDYVDVIQMHDVEFASTSASADIIVKETLPALQEAVKANKAKYIGITGYPVSTLADYIKSFDQTANVDLVLSYTRLSLLDNTLKSYLPLFKSNHLGIINAAANCMGLLSSTGPQDWHPASDDIKRVCSEARNYCKSNNVELARLALYYALQQAGPHTHLVGMNTRQLLRSNLDVTQNGLSAKEAEVYDYVKNRIMVKLQTTHWEGVEVETYKKLLEDNARDKVVA